MLPATVDNTHSSSLPWEQLCRRFSLAEIRSTTQNFDDALVIGQGGFGKVYRGTIIDGLGRSSIAAAIKRLDSRSKQGASEFWAEIEMLSKLRHCHLVSLIGYCNEFDEMILVYEFMPHGTLGDHLHIVGTRLSWLQRLKICIGAARGLDYLHTGSGTRHGVIHRDVKTSNILLDENWEAKISDFGLSKVGPKNQPSTFVSTAVKGTFGYVDPEYFLTGRLTRKSDVYAFGVVLLEVLCGRRAVDRSLDEDQWGLAGWAQDCIKKGKLEQIVDSSLSGQILLNCLEEFAQIAEWCLRSRPDERPTMAEVVGRLELALALQETPDYPGPGYSATPPRKITFTRKILKFFFPCLGPLMKNGKNEEGTSNNKFSNEDLEVNKESDVSQEVQQSAQIVTLNVKVFTFAELKQITRNFRPDRLLGEGSFGVVYKGMVDEETYEPSNAGGMFVAVKKREANSGLGQAEWQAEVNFLGQFGHPNIIHLLGYCREDQEFLLVYEFMTNGSLDTHIFSRRYLKPLPWAVRLKIMIGAAQGLAFLHTMDNQVIHRNFKSSSILLDADYNPKLSGFGLAKCGSVSDDCSHVSTRVMGTSGYAAPEYVLTGHLTAKSDVYGFGVVLLEVLTGRRVLDVNRPSSERNLVEWARPCLSNKRKVRSIVDGRLENQYPVRGAVLAAELALQCLNVAPKNRPSMKEVLQTLEKINAFKFQPEDIRDVKRATARQAGPPGRGQIKRMLN